jgi:tetratricopeptide (TPR) repeat protein
LHRSKIFGTVLIAASYLVDGNFPKAVEWSEKVNTDGKEIIHENCALLVKGIAYLLNGDNEKAKYALESMVGYCSEKWPYLSISGEIMLAVLEVASGRMNDGMKIILEIRNEFQKNERRYDCALSEYLLGSIYCQIALGEGHVSLSTIINNLGFLLKNLPYAAKKAENHLNEAIVLADKFEAMGIKGQALLDLGRLYAGKKRIKEAKDCLMKAIETFELCEIETFKQKAQDTLAALN